MTGFGKAEFEVTNKKISIEIKSLNSKQIDINTRTPAIYREKDIAIRRELSEQLVRGKVDLIIFVENLGDESNSKINEPVLKSYFEHLKEIGDRLNLTTDHTTLQAAMRLPDVVKTEYETLEEEEWEFVFSRLKEAISDIDDFRTKEGLALETDICNNISSISKLLSAIEPYEQNRIETIKQRLSENIESLKLNGSVDENRFEQELIFYLEKLDINEEKVRLSNHCAYFLETVALPRSSGKKLGFIAQEIGREINTIGSKANHSEIQKIVVQMKDHLERVKEQLLNVL